MLRSDAGLRPLDDYGDAGNFGLAKRKTVFELERELRALQTPTLIMVGDRDAPCVEPSLLMRNWMPHAGS
jgi:pimeloyl-ACP methyl ester carboxylesterase